MLFVIDGSSLAIGTLAVNANGELYAGILGFSTETRPPRRLERRAGTVGEDIG